MIKHAKPASLYDTFDRKGSGQKNTHYCPGCGHGTATKLLAEAIDILDIRNKTILCSPVGCSVFGYYYFDTGNIQCSHGRAAAVATAVKRTRPESTVISYQGDGDLAGIGLGAIVHAANRGENITVFFVNNAIYGMTGGQMAPTTLLGQKTTTTPDGREPLNDGYPMRMSEMLATLDAPTYIERVSLATGKGVLHAKKVFKKALENQIDGVGFSFVEILSPCPVNWKMSPLDARQWITNVLEPVFPTGNFRDRTVPAATPSSRREPEEKELYNLFTEKAYQPSPAKTKVRETRVKIAGFGGQGVLSGGTLLANCASFEGRKTTWLPSYGPEMRGGTANASVIFSDDPIGSPVVDEPDVLIAMNEPSLTTFETKVKPGGMIIVNQSMVSSKVTRDDVNVVEIPATQMAADLGVPPAANVIALAAFLKLSKAISIETLKKILPETLKKKKFVPKNLEAIDAALKHLEQQGLSD